MTTTTTQSFVPVKEIRDGIIIRDDGILCAVILVSPINFNLKSDAEREAITFQFQSVLNSLEVGVQILIQSRRLNIKGYLTFLEDVYKNQPNELLGLQTREYINFIKDFTESNEIMTKQFFVIVTYSPIQAKGFSLPFVKNNTGSDKSLSENISQLLQRTSFIQNNIRSLGIRTAQLGTDEVTELLYQTFNPGDTQAPPSV
ncbi:MAG: hypothetical protein OYG31_03115 [Candidatus Kaiserbacteria bacterium]|nr:hypothetical protein [Candidatus Kaiserbacteria bacterium]